MSVMTTALRDSLKTQAGQRCRKLSTPASPEPRAANSAPRRPPGPLQDEITRCETVTFERRLRKARFEQQATLEGCDCNACPNLPAAQIRDPAALRWLHSGDA